MASEVDIPVGDALDRAVALAMGWTVPDTLDALAGHRFSTDPRMQDELLAALHTDANEDEYRHDFSIRLDRPDEGGLVTVSIHVGDHGDAGRFKAVGPTISEALCRLLLVVTEARHGF